MLYTLSGSINRKVFVAFGYSKQVWSQGSRWGGDAEERGVTKAFTTRKTLKVYHSSKLVLHST
jgi:hypothetical protein